MDVYTASDDFDVIQIVVEPSDNSAQFYLNGQLTIPQDVSPELPDINLRSDLDFSIGNRSPVSGERSTRGTISYAAVYDVALSEEQLNQNLERLLKSDDGDQ